MSVPSTPYNINDLPNNVFETILQKITFQDTLNCSLVCKKWLELVNQSPHIQETTKLKIDEGNIDSVESFEDGLLREHKNVSITDIDFDYISPNISSILNLATHVSFVDTYFATYKVFRNVLRSCGDLEYLEIESPQVQTPDEKWLRLNEAATSSDYETVIKELLLNFEADDEGHSWELLKVFRVLPTDLRCIQIVLDAELQYESTRNLFHYLHQHYEKVIFGIKINDQTGDDEPSVAYKLLASLVRMTNMELLHFSTLNVLKDDTFNMFLESQPHITELELGNFTEDQFICILKCLPDLTVLNLTVQKHINPKYLSDNLHRLLRLQRLTLAFVEQVVYDFDASFISWLDELESFRCASDDDNRPKLRLNQLYTPLRRLKEFYISGMVVKYNTLQKIFQLMPNLEELLLCLSFWVKPSGVLGCKNSKDHSIGDLKSLKFLSLDVTAVDDQVLDIMKFPELKFLEFVGYEKKFKVTDKGLHCLSENCSKLKQIQFDETVLDRDEETGEFKKWHQPISEAFVNHSPNDSDSDMETLRYQ